MAATGTIAITDGKIELEGGDVATGKGGDILMTGGNSGAGQVGGNITITPGQGGPGSAGGAVTITAGAGGSTSGKGGNVSITSGAARGANSDGGDISITVGAPVGNGTEGKITIGGHNVGPAMEIKNGGLLYFHNDVRLTEGNSAIVFRNHDDTIDNAFFYGLGLGQVAMQNPNGAEAVLDVTHVTSSSETYTFPDYSGEFVNWVSAPATASSTGKRGMVAYQSGFFYVCVAINTWQRVAIATW